MHSKIPYDDYPVESWEVFLWARQHLGITTLTKIFNIGTTQAYRYCTNPRFDHESTRRNPIDNLKILFEEMREQGGDEVIKAALNDMASVINHRVQPVSQCQPDKQTMEEECLDDYPGIVKLHDLIQKQADISLVHAQADQVKREISETVELYRKMQSGEAD